MVAPADRFAQSDSTLEHPAPFRRNATAREEAQHDTDLVQRFIAGDGAAFDEIIARYRERMFSVAFAVLRNRGDAEEIAQDTFIRAHRGLANFRGESSLATWLHRIALNLARNRYWYFFRRQRHTTLSLDASTTNDGQASFADMVATDAAGPEREALTSEFSALVAACMERLGDPARTILTLRNGLNRSYGEIARELGISVGTVKSRIARARANLRVLLAETSPDFTPAVAAVTWFDPIRHVRGGAMRCA